MHCLRAAWILARGSMCCGVLQDGSRTSVGRRFTFPTYGLYASLTPHPLYLAIDRDDAERQAAYRELFRAQLDSKAIDDIRLALNQNQPLGNSRFYAKIETMTGQRREAKARGRPRVEHDESAAHNAGQGKLGL